MRRNTYARSTIIPSPLAPWERFSSLFADLIGHKSYISYIWMDLFIRPCLSLPSFPVVTVNQHTYVYYVYYLGMYNGQLTRRPSFR